MTATHIIVGAIFGWIACWFLSPPIVMLVRRYRPEYAEEIDPKWIWSWARTERKRIRPKRAATKRSRKPKRATKTVKTIPEFQSANTKPNERVTVYPSKGHKIIGNGVKQAKMTTNVRKLQMRNAVMLELLDDPCPKCGSDGRGSEARTIIEDMETETAA